MGNFLGEWVFYSLSAITSFGFRIDKIWSRSKVPKNFFKFIIFFSKYCRYCHGSEVSAVDVAHNGSIVISGSRDQTVKVWRVAEDDFLSPISTINIGDRIWSLATSKAGCVAVGM